MLLALALFLFSPSPGEMASESWDGRERVECELAARGPLAWPWLLDASRHESPEVRHRVYRLLTPYRVAAADAFALAVLSGAVPVDPFEFYADADLRLRVHHFALASGVPDYAIEVLLPSDDDGSCFWRCNVPAFVRCYGCLLDCRQRLGFGFWFFTPRE